jgi:4-hydroxy-tetrahydrodipicolinate synthase
MLMPAMVYKGDARETLAHFRTVAARTGLPIMIYNNPISYGNDITPEMFAKLAEVPNFVALKESSGNVRRITDIHNAVGGRFQIFTGVDDLVLESAILGIDGWVAGSGIAFPKENQYFWELTRAGNGTKPARSIAGSPPCSTWTPISNSSNTSSSPFRNAAWAPNGSVLQGWPLPVQNGRRF